MTEDRNKLFEIIQDSACDGKIEVKALIELVKKMNDCKVQPPSGYPVFFNDKHHLPDDLNEFYTLCGGLGLFLESNYPLYIVSPQEFVLANPLIVGELCPDDISSEWYIIADDKNGQYITIDLASERLGQCYDSFWDRHGLVGNCPIIANSFSELLFNLIKNSGAYWYWLQDDYRSLGDAYDE